MSLEATLERIATALETIAKTGGTVAQATAELGKPDAAAPAPAPKTKPKANEAVKEAAASAATAVAAPAVSAPAQAAAPAAPSGAQWPDVLAKIQLLNKGTAEGQGRAGVEALLTAFGLDFKPVAEGGNGQTVPALKALDKNAEVLAWVEARLNPAAAPAAPAGDIDLGL